MSRVTRTASASGRRPGAEAVTSITFSPGSSGTSRVNLPPLTETASPLTSTLAPLGETVPATCTLSARTDLVSPGALRLTVTRGPEAGRAVPPHPARASGITSRTRRRTPFRLAAPLPGGPAGARGPPGWRAGLARPQRALHAAGELVAARRGERDADRPPEAAMAPQRAPGLRVRPDREVELAGGRRRPRLAADANERAALASRERLARGPERDVEPRAGELDLDAAAHARARLRPRDRDGAGERDLPLRAGLGLRRRCGRRARARRGRRGRRRRRRGRDVDVADHQRRMRLADEAVLARVVEPAARARPLLLRRRREAGARRCALAAL